MGIFGKQSNSIHIHTHIYIYFFFPNLILVSAAVYMHYLDFNKKKFDENHTSMLHVF